MGRARSNRITELGELQVAVLERLGQLGEGTVYDVLGQFPRSRRPRYTTALTVLRTLEAKGLVTHRTEDRAYIFRPTVEVAKVRGRVVRDVLERVFGGSPKELMAAVLDVEGITPEVLAELRALIAQKEAEIDG
jgi:BlaI family transcriptional regulator, penicillinase repressor